MSFKRAGISLLTLTLLVLFAYGAYSAPPSSEGGGAMGLPGLPFGGGSEKVDTSICPEGTRVVGMFLGAWQAQDYRAMYELIDDKSKENYPFEQAKFDFQLLEFKAYKLSSIRRDGDNYEFILTYGDWKDGDKDTRKMIISGETFKIIMPTRNSPFKESADQYF